MDNRTFSFFLLVLGVGIIVVSASPVQNRGPETDEVGNGSRPSKRTFCNAFTGCGRKRSSDPGPKDYPDYFGPEGDDDSERNKNIEDVARDILAEARLWEAYQQRSNRPRKGLRGKGRALPDDKRK